MPTIDRTATQEDLTRLDAMLAHLSVQRDALEPPASVGGVKRFTTLDLCDDRKLRRIAFERGVTPSAIMRAAMRSLIDATRSDDNPPT